LTELAVLVYFCVYLHDDDLVDFETARRNKSDKRSFVTKCAICCRKYRIIVTIILIRDLRAYI